MESTVLQATILNGAKGADALKTGTLGARHVIFFVIAAAAPLGFSVGAIPLALGRGGVGTSGMFIVCGAVVAIFAVGYVAMAGHIRRVGGLYLFVLQGLGRPLGIGTAFIAVLCYSIASTAAIGAFGVFAQQSVQDLTGWDSPWQLWAFVAIAGMAALGVLGVELNARVLGVVIMCEIGILLAVSIGVVIHGGADGLSGSGFAPHDVFGTHPGAILAITISAFAGFEATVLFSEEVRDRARTIRRATYGAIAVMVVLYTLVAWTTVQAYGTGNAGRVANSDPTGMLFGVARTFVGSWADDVMEVLVVTSWFASILAFHNATSRYMFALGRDRVFPAAFGRTTQRFGSPWVASVAHSVFTLVVVVIFVVAQRDPFLDLYVLGSTPGVIGIPVMELLASVAVFAFFLRDRRGRPWWKVQLCPALAAIALGVIIWFILLQLDLFTARKGVINIIMPMIVVAAAAAGTARALWLRNRRPDVYAALDR